MIDAQTDGDDPKGLVREAYNIEGITIEECRSIFLDWALSLAAPPREAIPRLLARYGAPDHPMTRVLRDGLAEGPRPARRGGRAGRLGGG
ncbi:hypothetical protein JQC91_09885 [Jannaschia sp. Os4]|uniref:hypothetical protein n=1 Tax=Jannaschia sp. Os4 TaxID=2807617 RepID=UPI0019392B66|nr:hypothetical protein [Jannaschia sp. Os4]MBM2576614.1 hypothetical protein [Jannaschia sp. Os4]